MHLIHQRGLALGEGFEPSWCRINSAVPYQLGDPRMELTAGVEPASPLYERGILPLNYASEYWRPGRESNSRIAALQAALLPFEYLAMAEEARLELANQLRRRFSKAVAYQLAVLLLAEATGVGPARRLKRLASNELGLPMPNASVKCWRKRRESNARPFQALGFKPSRQVNCHRFLAEGGGLEPHT